MKKFLFITLVLCVFVSIGCKREKAVVEPDNPVIPVTQVSGDQSGTWSGEIRIVGDVVIPDDETLTIDAGTRVIADGYYEILVLGNLYAQGTENSRITFTVADTTGYSNYEIAEKGAWNGFYFQKPGVVELNYCDFSYGKNQDDTDGGMMFISMANEMTIANCRFHHNTTRRKGGAIYAENSSLNIHDCEVDNNIAEAPIGQWTWGVGFQFLKCDLDIHDMVFHDNNSSTAYGGGMNIDSCSMVLTNAIFYNNNVVNAGGLGIQRCKDYTVKVANMLAYNNTTAHYGGGLAMATSDPELNNLTIVGNYCGAGGGGMQMAFNACPTINNCIFWDNSWDNHGIGETTVYDSVEYYDGSQIWLWGDDNYPKFNNGLVMYGFDYIFGSFHIPEDHYNNMLEENPMFVNEDTHDYQLLGTSPCINTGVSDILGLFIPDGDLSGRPRIYNNIIDMGCYEWQGNK